MKPLGSITFKTTVIRTDEYLIMAKVMKDDGLTNKEAFLHISALDDMLSLLRIQTIIVGMSRTATGRLRKNSSFSSLIEHRIELLIDDLKLNKDGPEDRIVQFDS